MRGHRVASFRGVADAVDAQPFADAVADLCRGSSEAYGSWKMICIRRRQRFSSLAAEAW